jgi:Flp pilus assembly protein TadD
MCAMLLKAATALALVVAISAPTFAAEAPKPAPPSTAKTQAAPPLKLTAAQRAEADRLEPVARATFWAKVFDTDPTDEDSGVRLSVALRNLKRFQEASDVAEQVLVQNPKNYDALLESARAKIGGQQAFFAIAPLKTAVSLQPKDWRPVSLLGIAYDETERRDLARETYRQALAQQSSDLGQSWHELRPGRRCAHRRDLSASGGGGGRRWTVGAPEPRPRARHAGQACRGRDPDPRRPAAQGRGR